MAEPFDDYIQVLIGIFVILTENAPASIISNTYSLVPFWWSVSFVAVLTFSFKRK